jgi:hypothetical protein
LDQIHRICSRAQKGYNSQRYTQEVLINTWEKVNYCKKNGIRGAVVVAIDMAKKPLIPSPTTMSIKFANFLTYRTQYG